MNTCHRYLVLLALCFGIVGCGSPTPPPSPVVKLSSAGENTTVMTVGKPRQFDVDVTPSDQRGKASDVELTTSHVSIGCEKSRDMWTWYCTGAEKLDIGTIFVHLKGPWGTVDGKYTIKVVEQASVPSPTLPPATQSPLPTTATTPTAQTSTGSPGTGAKPSLTPAAVQATQTAKPAPSSPPLAATGTSAASDSSTAEILVECWKKWDARNFDGMLQCTDSIINNAGWVAAAEEQQAARISSDQCSVTPDPKTCPDGDACRDYWATNWALNDVTTALFIRELALNKQSKQAEAKAACLATAKYSCAYAWDTKGWFWNLSKGARTEYRTAFKEGCD